MALPALDPISEPAPECACRRWSLGWKMCDPCAERARILRAAEIAAARVFAGIFGGILTPVINSENTRRSEPEKVESPEVASPGSLGIHRGYGAAGNGSTARVRTEGITSRWRPWPSDSRPEVFAAPALGYGLGAGGRFTFTARRSVAGLLRALPPDTERVYLTGPIPGHNPSGFRSWATPAKMPAGWEPAPAGHFVERPENPVLKYTRATPAGPQRVEILRAAHWYGEGDYTPELARRAREQLAGLIRSRFPQARGLLATPTWTGVSLWRSLIGDDGWDVLAADMREEIRATMGQGRQEFFPPAAGAELPEVAVFDARFSYASVCRELPAGIPTRTLTSEFDPYARARYRFTATVPAAWPHPGVLGHKSAEGWEYPAEPGRRFSGWADGAEIHLARRAGWPVDIHEAIVWPKDAGDPLRGWVERLVALRAGVERQGDDTAPLVRAALRSIVLYAIGRFGAGARMVTRSAPIHEPGAVPAGARRPRVEGDRIVWAEPEEPDKTLAHPEWTAAVYGRARARLLHSPTGTAGVFAGALYAEPGTVLRFYTDSLTLTTRPAWPDDGRIGRLRLKSYTPGPIPAPATETALVALQRAGESRG